MPMFRLSANAQADIHLTAESVRCTVSNSGRSASILLNTATLLLPRCPQWRARSPQMCARG